MSFMVVSKAIQALKDTFWTTSAPTAPCAVGTKIMGQPDPAALEASKAEVVDLQRRIVGMPRLTAGKDQLHFDI